MFIISHRIMFVINYGTIFIINIETIIILNHGTWPRACKKIFDGVSGIKNS